MWGCGDMMTGMLGGFGGFFGLGAILLTAIYIMAIVLLAVLIRWVWKLGNKYNPPSASMS